MQKNPLDAIFAPLVTDGLWGERVFGNFAKR